MKVETGGGGDLTSKLENWQAGCMKTTMDLPDELVRQLKLRAVHEGRKMKDLAAELLRSGLTARPRAKGPARPAIVKDKKTGLPVIQCRRAAPRGQPTAEQVAGLLADQEAGWAHESG